MLLHLFLPLPLFTLRLLPPLLPPSPKLHLAPSDGGGDSGSVKFTGALTYYTLGMGACGEDDGGKDQSESIVAISHRKMGEQSNGTPCAARPSRLAPAARLSLLL
ncbi:hypothetical protein J3459_006064 [Metarhizium acridum]|nr:hypothetical protein J3459_006064 [Metarhizium acridum]